jgi:hypothetical protein
MANWSRLREALASIDDRDTYAWGELDELVGGLPRSAYEHAAFWKGDRSGWPGFTTVDVRVGHSVTFVRRLARQGWSPTMSPIPLPVSNTSDSPDLVLVGCVKQKLDRPAPAQDLYTSALFRKARAYAEASGAPWFVLSAKHGLVAPETVLDPYDLRLSKKPGEYRRAWGARVVDQLKHEASPLAEKVIEVHAGAAYCDAIRDRLRADGAQVVEPLYGLTMGRRLAWYGKSRLDLWDIQPPLPLATVADLVEHLGQGANAQTLSEFLATGGTELRSPGIYSWWVDHDGSRDLAAGLSQPIAPGLIYAGVAGATRSLSGRRSKNTLWGRIRDMHLGGRHEFSTFRLSLGSILASARKDTEIDEERLTAWMHEHLRVAAIPVGDADALDSLENAVLRELDPPLNLNKMPPSPIRGRLTELRRRYSRKTR